MIVVRMITTGVRLTGPIQVIITGPMTIVRIITTVPRPTEPGATLAITTIRVTVIQLKG